MLIINVPHNSKTTQQVEMQKVSRSTHDIIRIESLDLN